MPEKEGESDPAAPIELGQMTTVLSSLPPTDPATLKAFRNGRLAHQHYAAIGRVAAMWARFEVTIDLWLIEFAGVPPEVGICFTGQLLGPRARVDAFMALARHLGAADRFNKPLEKLATAVQGLGEQRNRAVHDVWELQDAAEPLRLERTAKRKLRALAVHVPTKELHKLEWQISRLDMEFAVLAAQIWHQLHASPGKPQSDPVP
jgi:hypothetical protein